MMMSSALKKASQSRKCQVILPINGADPGSHIDRFGRVLVVPAVRPLNLRRPRGVRYVLGFLRAVSADDGEVVVLDDRLADRHQARIKGSQVPAASLTEASHYEQAPTQQQNLQTVWLYY